MYNVQAFAMTVVSACYLFGNSILLDIIFKNMYVISLLIKYD